MKLSEPLLARCLRPALRFYPLPVGKGWLANRLLRDEDVPEGIAVSTKEHLLIRLYPDAMYKHLYLYGEYEPANTRLFKRLVRPGDICLDAGASFGYYTCLLARRKCTVYALEPLEHMFARNEENVRLNRLSAAVHPRRLALGEREGSLRVFTFAGLSVGHAAATDLGRSDAVPHECEMTTLDHFCQREGIAHLSFMKVDVEGHEWAVFKGGSRTLSEPDAPIVHFEVNEECLAHRRQDPNDILGLLGSYGYSDFFRIGRCGGLSRVRGRISSVNSDYVAAKNARVGRLTHA